MDIIHPGATRAPYVYYRRVYTPLASLCGAYLVRVGAPPGCWVAGAGEVACAQGSADDRVAADALARMAGVGLCAGVGVVAGCTILLYGRQSIVL